MKTSREEHGEVHHKAHPGRLVPALLLTLMVLITFLLLLPEASAGKTITVDQRGGGDFTTIQDAVDAAGDGTGDLVFVMSGNYEEKVSVEKTLDIQGESQDDVSLDELKLLAPDIEVGDLSPRVLVLEEAEGTTVTGVNVTFACYLNSSTDNLIQDSKLGALKLLDSRDNEFESNQLVSLNVLRPWGPLDFHNLFSTSNTVLGEPVLYLVGQEDRELDLTGERYGLLLLAGCQNLSLEGGLFLYEGVQIVDCQEMTLGGMAFATAREQALLIHNSSDIKVEGSVVLTSYEGSMSEDVERETGLLLPADFEAAPEAGDYYSPLGLTLTESLGCDIQNNWLYLNGSVGLKADTCSGLTVSGNRFLREEELTGREAGEGPVGTGMRLELSLQSELFDNLISGYKYGIYLSQAQDTLLESNQLLDCQFAFRSLDSSEGVFRSNSVMRAELAYLFQGSFARAGTNDGRELLDSETVSESQYALRSRDACLRVVNLSLVDIAEQELEAYESSDVLLLSSPVDPANMDIDSDSRVEVWNFLILEAVNRAGDGVPGCQLGVSDSDDSELEFFKGQGEGKKLWVEVLSKEVNHLGSLQHYTDVELSYSDFTDSRERLMVEEERSLSIVVEGASPLWVGNIPDGLSLKEDQTDPLLLDLSLYFRDELEEAEELHYTITGMGDTNATRAELKIVDGHYLSVGINGFTGKDWHGRFEELVVAAADLEGKSTQSPGFTITVTPVNDPPRLSVEGEVLSKGLTVYEDQPFWLPLTVTDVDNSLGSLQLATGDSRVQYLETNSTLKFLFPEGAESTVLNISAFDGENSGFVEFNVHFQDVNDKPTLDFLITQQELVDQATISWLAQDPDSQAQVSLYYDIDTSGEDGVPIFENRAESDGEDSVSWELEGIPKGYYYLYAIIEDEESRVVVYHQSRVRVAHSILSLSLEEVELIPPRPGSGDELIVRGKVMNSGDVAVTDATLTIELDGVERDQFVLSGSLAVGETRNFELYAGRLDSSHSRLSISYETSQGGDVEELYGYNLQTDGADGAAQEDEADAPGFELVVLAGVLVLVAAWKKREQN